MRARHEFTRSISAYLGGLTVPAGDHAGAAFEVLPWEADYIAGAFDVAGDSALSIARGNGKSGLVAGLACAVVDPDGPLHGRRREVVCVASSFQQGRVIFEDCEAMLRARLGDLPRGEWRLQNSQNVATIEHRESGARIRCIGSDPKRAHGLRPLLVLADEPAQWDAAKRDAMLAALRTSLGKVPDSRLIALGTRPADESHWFARMLKQAEYRQVHAAKRDDPPFALRTIRKANPSYDHLPSLRKRIAIEAREADGNPDALASFKALRLNMGTADVDERPVLEHGSWQSDASIPRDDAPPIIGLDLGSGAAMSAAAAVWESGRMELLAAFPTEPSLEERGKRDGALYYGTLLDRGELILLGRNVVPVEAFLQAVVDRFGVPECIVADRWREAELRDAMADCGVICPFVARGQGFRDGGEDLRMFRRAMLDGHVVTEDSRLLTAACAEARTVVDPAGNEKLAKSTEGGRRRRARDDALAAAIVAVAEWWRRRNAPAPGVHVGGNVDPETLIDIGSIQQ